MFRVDEFSDTFSGKGGQIVSPVPGTKQSIPAGSQVPFFSSLLTVFCYYFLLFEEETQFHLLFYKVTSQGALQDGTTASLVIFYLWWWQRAAPRSPAQVPGKSPNFKADVQQARSFSPRVAFRSQSGFFPKKEQSVLLGDRPSFLETASLPIGYSALAILSLTFEAWVKRFSVPSQAQRGIGAWFPPELLICNFPMSNVPCFYFLAKRWWSVSQISWRKNAKGWADCSRFSLAGLHFWVG